MSSSACGISGPVGGGRRRLDVGDLVDQAEVVRGLERQPAGEQVVHHHAHRVDVGAVVERMLLHLLRRHVGGRADRRDLRRVAAGDQRGAEVGDLHVGLAGVEDVGRLDVAVRDAHLVRELERARALEDDLDHLVDRQQVLRRAELLQRAAVDVLHHDVVQRLVGDRVVDLADVRVLQLAGERGLGDEQLAVELAALRVVEQRRGDQLDRDVALGERVVAEVDLGGRARSRGGARPGTCRSAAGWSSGAFTATRPQRARLRACALVDGRPHLRRRGAADVVARGDRAFERQRP